MSYRSILRIKRNKLNVYSVHVDPNLGVVNPTFINFISVC